MLYEKSLVLLLEEQGIPKKRKCEKRSSNKHRRYHRRLIKPGEKERLSHLKVKPTHTHTHTSIDEGKKEEKNKF